MVAQVPLTRMQDGGTMVGRGEGGRTRCECVCEEWAWECRWCQMSGRRERWMLDRGRRRTIAARELAGSTPLPRLWATKRWKVYREKEQGPRVRAGHIWGGIAGEATRRRIASGVLPKASIVACPLDSAVTMQVWGEGESACSRDENHAVAHPHQSQPADQEIEACGTQHRHDCPPSATRLEPILDQCLGKESRVRQQLRESCTVSVT